MGVRITFEGFIDFLHGYEVAPVVMMKPVPVQIEGDVDSIDTLIRQYVQALGSNRTIPSDPALFSPASARSLFYKARAKTARRGIRYWRRVVELTDDGRLRTLSRVDPQEGQIKRIHRDRNRNDLSHQPQVICPYCGKMLPASGRSQWKHIRRHRMKRRPGR